MPGRPGEDERGGRLRGRAARLRRRSPTARSRSRSSGISRRARRRAHRRLVEFRGARASCSSARPSPSRPSSPATRSRSPAISHRQGLPGHDQAAQLRARPEVARLAQHPQAGLDRRVGDALARLQGHQDGRPHGRQARHAARARDPRGRRRSATCCSSRAPSRARRTASSRSERTRSADGRSKAPLLDKTGKKSKDVTLEEAVFGAELKPHLVHEAVRAELNAAARGHARREEPRAGLRRPREAVAPEGHRPRPRRHDPRAAVDGRRRRVPAGDAQLRVKVNRKARKAALPRRRSRTTPTNGTLALLDGAAFDDARRRSARVALLGAWGKDAPLARRRDRGRGERHQELPQPRRASSSPSRRSSRSPRIVWARSLLVTEAALEAVQAGRAARRRCPREPRRRCCSRRSSREKSYA